MTKTVLRKSESITRWVGIVLTIALLGVVSAGGPVSSWAASDGLALDGAQLSAWWVIPFVGILLSIALVPLINSHLFHDHHGKFSAFWASLTVLGLLIYFGPSLTFYQIWHVVLEEYVPFLALVGSLYIVTSGIHLRGDFVGTPLHNLSVLAIGSLLASFIGTTGASMLLVRLLLRANENRSHPHITMIFFIFLVANIGGGLSPIGDPPLFLGFLQGVPFFWPTVHLMMPTLFAVFCVLGVYFVIDSFLFRREMSDNPEKWTRSHNRGVRFHIDGAIQIPLLGVIIVLVISSSVSFGSPIDLFGVSLSVMEIVRDVGLIMVASVSFLLSGSTRIKNQFEWFPILEVAKLFAGIFITILPVIAILKVGADGSFGAIYSLLSDSQTGDPLPLAYFVVTGLLSAFLDNAPTYLVFFNAAGGNAEELTTTLAPILTAISAGAVYGGGLSYIGNAPNFLIRSIAISRGVQMPSFLGFMAWSLVLLIPVLAVIGLLFLR